MPEQTEISEGDKVLFNLALRQVKLIGDLIEECQQCAAQGNLNQWFYMLLGIRREISHKFDKGETEELNNLFSRTSEAINELDKYKKNPEIPRSIFSSAFMKLDELERRLMKLMDKYDYLIPSKADPRFAVLRR